jgi:hypothetical protein
MTVKKDAKAEAPAAPAAKKTPTAAQLAKLRKGGDYLFNPHSGELVQTRKPTQPEGK